jgi:DNA polymerase III subunit delta
MNIYLLFGHQEMMVNKRLAKLLKQHFDVLDEFNYASFDGKETLIQDIIAEAYRQPLLHDKKAIVIEDAYFLAAPSSKQKIDKDQDYQTLLKYIDNPSDHTILFFAVYSRQLNEKNPIVNKLKKVATINELTDIDKHSWPEYVRRYFANYNAKIEPDAVNELVHRCQNDVRLFILEAQKLMINGNHITLNDVENLVAQPIEDNAFLLLDALLSGQVEEALSIFRDLKIKNVEPVGLVMMLSTQLRLFFKIYHLNNNDFDIRTIAKQLNIHEYRVKLALRKKNTITIERINDLLERLYQLDFDIKSGAIDRYFAFEMLLLNFLD